MKLASAIRPADQAAPRSAPAGAPTAGFRRHWPAIALLAAGLVLRVLAQFAYQPALFYIDTGRYLSNQAFGMDPLGYKAPLVAISTVSGFGAVAAVQHLLGLAMAVLIYVLLGRRGTGRWLGALAIAPVLLDAYQIQIEQTLMPDVWFEALIVGGLAILLWRPGVSWRRVVGAGLVLGTSATVAQVGEALLLPAVIYLLVLGGGWRQVAGKAAVLGGSFALPILAYCTGTYLVAGSFFLSHTGVTSLYGRVAAAADCAALRLPLAERGMCPTPAQQAEGPDWLEYDEAAPVEQSYYDRLPRAEVDSLITDFNSRVLAQQPLSVASAYGRDLLKLFMPTRVSGAGDTPISRWQFQVRYPYYQHAEPDYVASQIGRAPRVTRPLAVFLRAYQLDGGYTPGPLFVAFTLAGLAGSVVALRRRTGTAERAQACLLFFGTAVSVLAVSDLFEFSWRYQLPALVTLVPAGVLGLAVLARRSRTA